MSKLSEKAVAAAKKMKDRIVQATTAVLQWPFNSRYVNPYYKPRKGGLMWFWIDRNKGRITAQDVGRWMPHSGAREQARNLRKIGVRHAA